MAWHCGSGVDVLAVFRTWNFDLSRGRGLGLYHTSHTHGLGRSALELIGAAAILGSAALAALAQIFVRRLVATEGTAQIVFYFSLLITLLSFLSLPFGWVVPSFEATVMLVTAGLIGGVGQICLTAAYRNAPASVVAPFDYTSMLLALAIAYFWFAEIPTGWTILGASVIIASGVVIIWREQRLGRRRNRAQSTH